MHMNIARVLILACLMTSLFGCDLVLEPRYVRGIGNLGCTAVAVVASNSSIDKPVPAEPSENDNGVQAQSQGVVLKFLRCSVGEVLDSHLLYRSRSSFKILVDFEIKNDSGDAISLARDTLYLTGPSSSQAPDSETLRCDSWQLIPRPEESGSGSTTDVPPGGVRQFIIAFNPKTLPNGEIGCFVPVSLGDEGKITFELRLSDEAKAK